MQSEGIRNINKTRQNILQISRFYQAKLILLTISSTENRNAQL